MSTTFRPKVRGISRTLSWIRWSPRIGSIEDAGRRKSIAYIGFPDKESATKFYQKVTSRRTDWRWQPLPKGDDEPFHDGRGLCKPRKSERLSDFPYECKWHRPPLEFIEGLIRWELGQTVEGHQLIEAAYNNR